MRSSIAVVVAVLALASRASVAVAGACHARSGDYVVPLVELYTSEGCDSCPAADRWLSSGFAAASSDAIALAFHVDYWDRLGWKDRFASAEFTERQHQAMRARGATFVYTPQVLLQGRDHREWRGRGTTNALAAARMRKADVSIVAEAIVGSDDVAITAAITRSGPGGSEATVAFAYVDDGLVSEVKAGENRGVRLVHDHVVRAFEMRSLDLPSSTFRVALRRPGERGAHPRVVVFVQDPRRGDVVQALALPLGDCS